MVMIITLTKRINQVIQRIVNQMLIVEKNYNFVTSILTKFRV